MGRERPTKARLPGGVVAEHPVLFSFPRGLSNCNLANAVVGEESFGLDKVGDSAKVDNLKERFSRLAEGLPAKTGVGRVGGGPNTKSKD